MNANLLTILKQIVTEQGESVLADPQRLKALFSDYAKNEQKEERVAFGRCIEMGAYQELKKTSSADERRRVKATLADQVNAKTGIDRARCAEALDLLEAVMFKPEQQSQRTICSNCGKELQKEWKVCPYCKTSQNAVCSNCGKELQKEWTACPYCSTQVGYGIEQINTVTPVYSNNLQTQPPVQPEAPTSSGNAADKNTTKLTGIQSFFVFLVSSASTYLFINWNVFEVNVILNILISVFSGIGLGVALLGGIFIQYNESKKKKK
jgi:DNA-directed RNA polymerase subunit RPC12/RpoP